MKWRKLAIVLLVAVALVVAWSLWDNALQAPEPDGGKGATRQEPSDQAKADPSQPTGNHKTDPASVDEDEELGPPEAVPETIEVRLIGRIVYKPPCPYERFATLAQLKPEVTFELCDGEDTLVLDIDFNTEVKEDGSFLSVVTWDEKVVDEDDDRLLLLPTPGDRYDITIKTKGEFKGDHVWRQIEPKIRENTLDFGDLSLGLSDLTPGNKWLLVGRLQDGRGEPLRHLRHGVLLGPQSSTAYFMDGMTTDADGWFTTLTTDYEQNENEFANASWALDVSDTSYINDNLWPTADSLIRMPTPKADVDRRVLNFGDVKLPAAVLDVSLILSEEAEIALKANNGHVFLCHLVLSNGDVSYSFHFAHDKPFRAPVVPGKYRVQYRLALRERDEDGEPPIVYPPEAGPALPELSEPWEATVIELTVTSEEVHKLPIDAKPVREVNVHVDTDNGPLERASIELRIRRQPAEWYDDGEFVEVRRSCTLPQSIRVNPGDDAAVTAHADGYTTETMPIPPTGDTLRIRLRRSLPGAKVTVRFSGDDPETHPPVRIIATSGLAEHVIEAAPGARDANPATFNLPAGEWAIHVAAKESKGRSPPPLSRTIVVTVVEGQDQGVTLPPLYIFPSREDDRVVYVNSTPVTGSALAAPGTGWRTGASIHFSYTMAIADGPDVHRWHREEIDGTSRMCLRLPERIRITLSDEFIASAGPDWREGIELMAESETSWCESTTCDRAVSLWAPVGPCRIRLRGPGGFVHRWRIDVRADKVTTLTIPGGFGTVRLLYKAREYALDLFLRRALPPGWVILRKTGTGLELASHLNAERISLLAGEYLLRPAFGPGTAADVSFTVTPGLETVVDVPVDIPVPCTGTIILSLPADFSGVFDSSSSWYRLDEDTELDSPHSWLNMNIDAHEREGKLHLYGLPLGETGVVRVQLSCQDTRLTLNWTALIQVPTLADTKPKSLPVEWKATPLLD